MFHKALDTERPRTRQAAGTNSLVVQFARTDPRKYSFAIRTVEEWNKLPEETRNAANKETFKARIKSQKK